MSLITSEWIDATPERIARALAAQIDTAQIDVLTPSGQKTGQKRRQIMSPIEQALRRGWITGREWMAGIKFAETVYAAARPPKVTASFDTVVIDSSRRAEGISDQRLRAIASMAKAMKSIDPKYRDGYFNWTYQGLWDDHGIQHLGSAFSRSIDPSRRIKKGKEVLIDVLDDLARHYGF